MDNARKSSKGKGFFQSKGKSRFELIGYLSKIHLSYPRQEAHRIYPLQDSREKSSQNCYLGQLEPHVSGMADYFRSDLVLEQPNRTGMMP